MNPLRMGVIGCGGIAQMMHIPYMNDYENFEIVALADLHRPTLEAVGAHYRISNLYTDWRQLLARADIDAVGIFHAGSHYETVIAALDTNKHILVEKPLAWNLRETEEIAARAARSDRIVQLGYHKLYDPGFAYAREQVKQIDDLGYVRITVLHPADEYGRSMHRVRVGDGKIIEGHVDIGSWEAMVEAQQRATLVGALAPLVDEVLGTRKEDRRLRFGYTTLVQSMIHQVYTLFGFLGEPSGVARTDIWRDGFSIHSLIEYPNDLRVSLDWQFLPYLKDYHEEYAFFGNHQRVYFTLPSPYFRNFPSPVTIQGHDGELAWEKRVIVNYEEAFRNELLEFYDNVQNRRQPRSSVQDALKHARFIQQMIDAAV
jgi:predicted dehydrogenase